MVVDLSRREDAMSRRMVSAKPATAHRRTHSTKSIASANPPPAIPDEDLDGLGSSAAIPVRKKATAITGRPAKRSQAVYFASLRPRILREACSNQKIPTQMGSRQKGFILLAFQVTKGKTSYPGLSLHGTVPFPWNLEPPPDFAPSSGPYGTDKRNQIKAAVSGFDGLSVRSWGH